MKNCALKMRKICDKVDICNTAVIDRIRAHSSTRPCPPYKSWTFSPLNEGARPQLTKLGHIKSDKLSNFGILGASNSSSLLLRALLIPSGRPGIFTTFIFSWGGPGHVDTDVRPVRVIMNLVVYYCTW